MSQNRQNSFPGEILNLELYTSSVVLAGSIKCPIGFRILDLFNSSSSESEYFLNEFIEFMPAAINPDENVQSGAPVQFIRKGSVYVVALTDSETGRGLGGKDSLKTYPYVPKIPRTVSIEMEVYSITGTAYLGQGHTVKDLLNERNLFFPLTEVTIARDYHLYGTRPLCLLNKQHLISLKDQPFDH